MSVSCDWMRMTIGERVVIAAYLQAMKELGVAEHPGGKCPTEDCDCASKAGLIDARALQIAEGAMAARKGRASVSTLTIPADRLAERIDEAEAEVVWLEERYGGLRDGSITWQQVWPELTCPEPQREAEEEYANRLDAARRDLRALREQQGGLAE